MCRRFKLLFRVLTTMQPLHLLSILALYQLPIILKDVFRIMQIGKHFEIIDLPNAADGTYDEVPAPV